MNEAFWRWFGDSVVRDRAGQPLVVYHGTPDARALFSPMKWGKDHLGRTVLVPAELGEEDSWGPGFRQSPSRGSVFFATDSYQMADSYADEHRAFDYQGAEPAVVPLYLSIQNPLIVYAEGKNWRRTEAMIGKALYGGHDGAIIHDVDDYYNVASLRPRQKRKPATVYVWFKPTQAKSALQGPLVSRFSGGAIEGSGPNVGTWDPEDADLRSNPVDYLNPRVSARGAAGRFRYVHSCLSSTYEDIQALKASERGVALATFRAAIGPEQWRWIQEYLGYDRYFPITKDWHVGYYQGVYRGVPAYFVRHSGIEHIFTLDGKMGPSLADAPEAE